MRPIIDYLKKPSRLFDTLVMHYGQWLPDRMYIKLRYRFKMGKSLHFNNVTTFNEKLQWLKLYNRKAIYTTMVDKYAVKDYVASIIGEDHIIPTIGVWDKPENIEWDNLPNQFVLKTTHGGGGTGVVICKDKSMFDYQAAIDKLNDSLKSDIYRTYREWPYKDVKKRVIAEDYLSDESGELRDYKFFCFNGKVKVFKVDFNRFVGHRANYFDTNGSILPFGEVSFPPDPSYSLLLPLQLKEMIGYAEMVAKDNPFLRIDFYESHGKVYFGEITFFPAGGMGRFEPDGWDKILGEWLVLPK